MNHLFYATTPQGLEPLLHKELTAFGATRIHLDRAGVSFEGTLETAYRLCLWSRVAQKVLLTLSTFEAHDERQLYGKIKSIKWSDHLSQRETMAVDFTSQDATVSHTHFGALKTKDAIVDQFRSLTGARPSVDTATPDVRVHVHGQDTHYTVSIDLSGESLHRRGYRDHIDRYAPAPLKETLAAGILLHCGWEKLSQEQGAPLLDPFCGTGTFLIEGAWIAARKAPGLNRRYFGFLGWKGHDATLWKHLRAEALDLEIKDPKKLSPIFGWDIDDRTMSNLRRELGALGLSNQVVVSARPLERFHLPMAVSSRPPGLLVANPPYGERMGVTSELIQLYQELGDTMKQKLPGWKAGIIAPHGELSKSIGLKPTSRTPLWNGALECRLLQYSLFEGSRKRIPLNEKPSQ